MLICALYLANITGMGMYGPDEPRYADIGRAMATTGDLVTPRLWGEPWFEKPALLYWMSATGYRAGLGPDLAPRLPVAILSVLFLVFFWYKLRNEWGIRVANYATLILATSGGWLAYSHVAVTDVPMAIFFSAAWLLALGWMNGESTGLTLAAASLALAVLAKALVPLVLFVPVLGAPLLTGNANKLRDWVKPQPLVVFLIVALPWYLLCTMRNGTEFLRVLFIEQQFGRLTSSALQHVQPWWFYFPVLLVLLFPWFPLLVCLPSGLKPADARIRTLAAIVIWGFLFFSLTINKLFGYLIPLLPAIAVLLAIALDRMKHAPRALILPIVLAGSLAIAPQIAARALEAHKLTLADIPWTCAIISIAAAGVIAALVTRFRPGWSFPAAAVMAIAGFLWFQFAAFPSFDRFASARPLWLNEHPACAPPSASRDLVYGWYYYSGRRLPSCPVLDPNVTRGVR